MQKLCVLETCGPSYVVALDTSCMSEASHYATACIGKMLFAWKKLRAQSSPLVHTQLAVDRKVHVTRGKPHYMECPDLL